MKSLLSPLRFSLLLLISCWMFPAHAADLGALKESFKQRYPALQELKTSGKIGETSAGWVEAVKGGADAKVNAVIAAENADRKTLYAALAVQQGIAAELVAQRNANRNFEKAAKGEWLKSDGAWKQK